MTPEAYCQKMVQKAGTSWYYSFLFLPPFRRKAIYALYAFCREADDIVDNANEPSIALKKLDWWKEEIQRVFNGNPLHPIGQALAPYVDQFPWEAQWFYDLLDGMAMDLEEVRFEHFDQLALYCYRAAGVVGLLSCNIFGYQNQKQVYAYAKDLGQALQLVNIIRDVGEDSLRGRIYIPEDELAQFEISREDILQRTCPQEKLKPLLAMQAQRARASYQAALLHLPDADRLAQTPGLIMAEIYFALLDCIENCNFDVLSQKIKLTPIRKLLIAWCCYRREKKHAKSLRVHEV